MCYMRAEKMKKNAEIDYAPICDVCLDVYGMVGYLPKCECAPILPSWIKEAMSCVRHGFYPAEECLRCQE